MGHVTPQPHLKARHTEVAELAVSQHLVLGRQLQHIHLGQTNSFKICTKIFDTKNILKNVEKIFDLKKYLIQKNI